MDDAVSILGSGVTVTTGAASANVAIPNTRDGYKPKFIRILSDGLAYIKVGTVATTNDVLVDQYCPVILNVLGATSISYIQFSAPQKVNIVPLENA
jgi:hypothetical protein